MVKTENKENDKSDSVSYCGLYCPDCPLYSGKISDLRKELRRVEYDKFAKYISQFSSGKEFKHFNECYDVLGAMIKFRCDKGCRQGGGTDNCQIRQCNMENNFKGCWECTKYENCKKLNGLNKLHGNAHRKNINIIQKKGVREFIKGKKYW